MNNLPTILINQIDAETYYMVNTLIGFIILILMLFIILFLYIISQELKKVREVLERV